MPNVTFILAACAECAQHYAVLAHPNHPGQWQVFLRAPLDFAPAGHLCSGALLCWQGHTLRVTQTAAVLSEQGHWVAVGARPKAARAN